MARDPGNVRLWVDANVYVSDELTLTLPTTAEAPFGATWDLTGVLDGDEGFDEERKWKETDHYGWGVGLIKTGYSEFQMTRTFTALEDNPITRGLLWPGSTNTSIVVPRPVSRFLAFEAVDDDGEVVRLITARPAKVWCGKTNQNESDLTKMPFECKIYGTGANELFKRQSTRDTV